MQCIDQSQSHTQACLRGRNIRPKFQGGTLFYSELPSSLFNLGMPTLFSGAHLTKPAPTQCPFLSERPLKIYQRPLVGGTVQVEDHWSSCSPFCVQAPSRLITLGCLPTYTIWSSSVVNASTSSGEALSVT